MIKKSKILNPYFIIFILFFTLVYLSLFNLSIQAFDDKLSKLQSPTYDTFSSGPWIYKLNDAGEAILLQYSGKDIDLVVPSFLDGHVVSALNLGYTSDCQFITLPATIKAIPYIYDLKASIRSITIQPDNHYFYFKDGLLFNYDKSVLLTCLINKTGNCQIPVGTKKIGSLAFLSCSLLNSVLISNTVEDIDYLAFDQLKCNELVIPDSVKKANKYALCRAKVNSMKIPDNLTIYDSYDDNLKEGFGFEKIDLSKSNSNSKYISFYGCDNLTEVRIDDDSQDYVLKDGVLFNKSMSELIFCPRDKQGSYVIPKSVKRVYDAFCGCNELTSLTLSENMTSKEEAIVCCGYLNNLETINVSKNNKELSSYDGVLYDKVKSELLYCPNKRKGDVIVFEGVKSIRSGIFDICEIESLKLPPTIKCIEPRGLPFGRQFKRIKHSANYSLQYYCKVKKDGIRHNVYLKNFTEAYRVNTMVSDDEIGDIISRIKGQIGEFDVNDPDFKEIYLVWIKKSKLK